MFTLTMTIWILAHGVGDPVRADTLRHQDTFATREECEAKGREDQPHLAELVAGSLEKRGQQDTVHDIVMSCKASGQEI